MTREAVLLACPGFFRWFFPACGFGSENAISCSPTRPSRAQGDCGQ